MTSVNLQMLVFFACIVAGLASGLIYDVFRAIRIIFSPKKHAIFLMDIGFWVICSFLLFSVVYITCGGELRWFEFLGLMLGMILYFSAISHIFLYTLVNVVKAIIFGIVMAWKTIFAPIAWLSKFIFSKINHINCCFLKKINKILRIIKKTLENIKRIGIILKKV